MATNTFDREIMINDPESLEKLARVMAMDPPTEPLSKHPYSDTDRKRSEKLLTQFLSRSGC